MKTISKDGFRHRIVWDSSRGCAATISDPAIRMNSNESNIGDAFGVA
ncbi:MAG: hypothetical protein K2K23_02780 [Muribaculaceae bacterium]|nr:hypothetical protein [Muribaculaceae bacterium]